MFAFPPWLELTNVNEGQVSGEQRDAARGAELLLSATLLHQYCIDDDDEADAEALEVRFGCSLITREPHRLSGLHRWRISNVPRGGQEVEEDTKGYRCYGRQ